VHDVYRVAGTPEQDALSAADWEMIKRLDRLAQEEQDAG